MKTCLFSVSYAGLWGQHRLNVLEFIRKASSLGYDAVMLMGKRPHLSPLDTTDQELKQIKKCLDEEGISCAAIGAYTDFSRTGAAEVPQLEHQIAYIESLAPMARAVGAGVIRVFTAYENPRLSPLVTWQQTLDCIRECCDRVEPFGVQIAVQNHHDIAVAPDAMEELIRQVDRPNCKLGFDAWSAALCGYDLRKWARQLAPHVAITTNADYARLPRFRYYPDIVNFDKLGPDMLQAVPFGTGFIDYNAFFAGLVDGGFDGVATYEMCSPIRGGGNESNLDIYARRYLQWMNEHVLTGLAVSRQPSLQPSP